ncbi:hypothetical protein EDB19DRAFT_140269 [Suillus lakei]|nr:hypothetical protein EDB19DRAFT_140269 [Suillus lakei]
MSLVLLHWCGIRPTSPSFPKPVPFCGQLSDLEYSPLASVEITGLLSEGADPPLGQFPQEILPCSSSGSAGCGPGARGILPQRGMYSEVQTLSSSPARHDEQRPPRIVRDKVQCTRSGCSSVVNKDNLTHHINEVHERKIKARCAGCRKGFARPYMMEGPYPSGPNAKVPRFC